MFKAFAKLIVVTQVVFLEVFRIYICALLMVARQSKYCDCRLVLSFQFRPTFAVALSKYDVCWILQSKL